MTPSLRNGTFHFGGAHTLGRPLYSAIPNLRPLKTQFWEVPKLGLAPSAGSGSQPPQDGGVQHRMEGERFRNLPGRQFAVLCVICLKGRQVHGGDWVLRNLGWQLLGHMKIYGVEDKQPHTSRSWHVDPGPNLRGGTRKQEAPGM